MSTVIDWSKYGRTKKPARPNVEISFYEKDGELRVRAEFPAQRLDAVADRIRRQLDYWRHEQR